MIDSSNAWTAFANDSCAAFSSRRSRNRRRKRTAERSKNGSSTTSRLNLANSSPNVALKEWRRVEKALSAGTQTVLFRKANGIDCEEKTFELESMTFVVFPANYHDDANRSRKTDKAPEMKNGEEVPLSIVLKATRMWKSKDKSVIKALTKFHQLNEDEVAKRVKWGEPNEAFHVLEVRAYRLPEEQKFVLPPDLEKYGGCKSWVELPFNVPDTKKLVPVMDQRDWFTIQSDLSRKVDYLKATGVAVEEIKL